MRETLENVRLLAAKELRDALRNRWLLLFALAFAGLALALAWLGLSALPGYGVAGFGRTAGSLVNLVLLVVPLMGLVLGALAIVAERERGTLLYLLAQPVTTGQVLAGKFLGLGLALAAALAAGFGASAAAIAWRGGAGDAGDYLALAGLAVLLAWASLAVGLLVSALARGAAVATGIAIFVWLALVVFGDLGVLGTALAFHLPIRALLALTLANPLEAFKIAAILPLQRSLEVLGPAGTFAVREYGAALLPFLVGLLVLWIAAPLAATHFVFRRRGAVG